MLITPRCYAQNTLTHKQPSNRLAIVVPKSLVLIALLYFASGSLVQAMLILLNVPLAVIGGVVMVESINQRVKDRLAPSPAIFAGANSRLRPVLIGTDDSHHIGSRFNSNVNV